VYDSVALLQRSSEASRAYDTYEKVLSCPRGLITARLVNYPASRMAGLMAGGLAASSQPARLYRKQGSSQPAEHQKPDGLIGLIV
jgi:hypothetical protein